MEDGTIDLPVTFRSKEAGHYPCKITLSSQDDIRVYQIDCTVTPGGSEAYIEFTCPVHQPITQDIPVVCISEVMYVSKLYKNKINCYICTCCKLLIRE